MFRCRAKQIETETVVPFSCTRVSHKRQGMPQNKPRVGRLTVPTISSGCTEAANNACCQRRTAEVL